jgi:error-prone DNA polymerase
MGERERAMTDFVHLHVRSWFSFLRGSSAPEALAARAAALGHPALALTDVHGIYGAVRFQKACQAHGLRPIFGAEVMVQPPAGPPAPLVLLAASRAGLSNLNRVLGAAHARDRLAPAATLDELAAHTDDLFCLTGGRGCHLWSLLDAERPLEALAWVGLLRELYRDRLSVELAHHRVAGDGRRIQRLLRTAEQAGVPPVATGDVRYAEPADYRRYDLMTCIRAGCTVFEGHPDRPTNAEASLHAEAVLRRRIPHPAAFARAAEIAAASRVDLLPGEITPPAARVPDGKTAAGYLRELCEEGFARRYREPRPPDTPRQPARAPLAPAGRYPMPAATRPRLAAEPPPRTRAARRQLEHELAVIRELDLDEFFLVVHEIVAEARQRGIRCAGRGSAANSIVAYLLGITGVDPLAHRLLFERFLHAGRRGTPDIDVDFDSERREEVIAWMEQRFGPEQTAMTATLQMYRLRSAVRDVAKALGWPIETVNALGKAVPHSSARRVREHRVSIEQVLGPSPLLEPLLAMVEGLEGCPRHLGLHSGGMVLSRRPLHHFTPVQVSANGVTMVQFDKDDLEALGLVKLDVLGLRMMATLSEADALIRRHEPPDRQGYPAGVSLDELPLDDGPTFNMIRAGRTLATFQIESQGQLHLLAQHQPETFDDLITEIALFRPGPLQGNMVHPFVRRRRGQEPVVYDHPDLEPILQDTFGIILFQEQILEVAHRFAGMSLEDADEFRRLMSRFRDPGQMEGMRSRFVAGAASRGVPPEVANDVFEKVSKFVGYGFCRSHAAAFAKTVYQSCYLKRHHPAAFMAAIMQHRPGMYNLMTLQEEARRFGVAVLPPDIHRSGTRYDLERQPGRRAGPPRLAIRMPLTAVKNLSLDDARALLWARLAQPFESLEDLYRRVAVPLDALRTLARSGALDPLVDGDARRALWEVGVLARRLGPAGQQRPPALIETAAIEPADIPALPPLAHAERLTWDLEAHDAAREHPVRLFRNALTDLEVRPIETAYRFGEAFPLHGRQRGVPPQITVGGVVMLRQRPPTANGVMFLTLEDETGFIQCVVRPKVMEHLDHVLRRAALIVRGQLHAEGNWRGLVVQNAWALDGIFGGYEGQLDYAGGRDRYVTAGASGAQPAAAARP